MQTLVTIGEFSRLSHLTAKALRHYHDVGLLTPAQVDPTGYRRYGVAQVQQAQLVRRLRLLEMPVPDIKAVLGRRVRRVPAMRRSRSTCSGWRRPSAAPQQVVASLRALLRPADDPIGVEYRTVAAIVGDRDQVPGPPRRCRRVVWSVVPPP